MCNEVEVFDLLKRNGFKLAPHLVNILKELGFNDIHTLAQIEDPESLQKSVVDTFGECQYYQTLPDDEKKLLLGPRFWRSPSCFKFLPGEQAALKSIKSICISLLEKQTLVHVSSSTSQANVSLNMTPSKQTQQQLPTTSTGRGSGNSKGQNKNETSSNLKSKEMVNHLGEQHKKERLDLVRQVLNKVRQHY